MNPAQADAEAFVAWEERAAILEHDGRFSRADAEAQATRELGYRPKARTVPICVSLDQRDPA